MRRPHQVILLIAFAALASLAAGALLWKSSKSSPAGAAVPSSATPQPVALAPRVDPSKVAEEVPLVLAPGAAVARVAPMGATKPRPPQAPRPGLQLDNSAKPRIPSSASVNAGAKPTKPPLVDPVAREALFFVGLDSVAEDYWLEAINDPGLSGPEREDLIEDLNEDGLNDPKHPSADDLPVILSRLALIEEVGGEAMDEVNADAFAEAYKDLVNLANLATGAARPVQ